MVPSEYKDFFLGSVTVAGALIGLLFVAVSVNPTGVSAEGAPRLRVRATSALAALVNALFVSLLALLPSDSLGEGAVILGTIGLLTLLSLLIFVLTRGRGEGRWELIRNLALIVGQGVAYGWQIISGLRLIRHPGLVGQVSTQTTLVIVLLAFGVARAWEYVGGAQTGLWGAVAEARRVVHAQAADEPAPEPEPAAQAASEA
jgi:hypothetical protein